MLNQKSDDLLTESNYKYKVSVIVPCYNVKLWLDNCLQSLVDQTLENIEIICVNDGSTDCTSVKLDGWQANHPNKIKVIHQKNGGLANARNTGMKIAQGECIGFVDSDDFIDLTMYEKLYQKLKNNNVDIVQCNFCYFNGKKNKIVKYTNYLEVKIAKLDDSNITNNISVWNRLYLTQFLASHKLYFLDKIRLFEDLPFSLGLLFHQPKIAIVDNILYYYCIDNNSSLSCHTGNYIFGIFEIFNLLIKKDENHNFKNLILKFKLSYYALSFIRLAYKLKIDFTIRASKDIFDNNKTCDIYKIVILSNYRKFYKHILGLGFVVFLHITYLLSKIR